MTRHIKTDRTVTQIDTYLHERMAGHPPQTVIATHERSHAMAGGPRDEAGCLADHLAALREIGAHDAASQIEHGETRPETVTLGLVTRLDGNWLSN